MPLNDLFGSLDSLTGGALSDIVSNVADSTSLDETIGNGIADAQDLAGSAEEVTVQAQEVAAGAEGFAQDAAAGVQDMASGQAEEVAASVQDAASGFGDVVQGSVDQAQEGLNGIIDGIQGNLGDLGNLGDVLPDKVNELTDAIPGGVSDFLGGLFNR